MTSFSDFCMRTRCGAENMPANVHIHILTKVHPRTLLKTLQWQVGSRVSRLSPFPGQLAIRSHTIPRGQVVHSSAMHHLILPSATPPIVLGAEADLGYSAVFQTLLQLQLIIHSGCQWPRKQEAPWQRRARKALSRCQPPAVTGLRARSKALHPK